MRSSIRTGRSGVVSTSGAANLTSRQNLVAVISNGTAVLGLGNIGPLASKPVMEGKAVLFKKFAGIDVFDIEIDERDPQKLVDIIASLEPTFVWLVAGPSSVLLFASTLFFLAAGPQARERIDTAIVNEPMVDTMFQKFHPNPSWYW